jgi:ABC-type multidrug transport system permease subunit
MLLFGLVILLREDWNAFSDTQSYFIHIISNVGIVLLNFYIFMLVFFFSPNFEGNVLLGGFFFSNCISPANLSDTRRFVVAASCALGC